MPEETLRCPCVTCSGETEHVVLAVAKDSGNEPDGTSWESVCKFVQCRGCKKASIREEFYLSEWDPGDVHVTYHPPRTKHQRPDWLSALEAQDQALVDLLSEVYDAANRGHNRLVASGIRTVMDSVMTKVVGDIGGFDEKLNAMVEKKEISESQRQMYDTVIEGGSAAAHRGYKPPWGLLETMLVLTEAIVHQTYIARDMLTTAKMQIPPRPPRVKK